MLNDLIKKKIDDFDEKFGVELDAPTERPMTKEIKSFLVASLAECARETVGAVRVEAYTFKKIDWGGGIITDEPVEDDTKSNAYATGYNDCVSEQRSRAEKFMDCNL